MVRYQPGCSATDTYTKEITVITEIYLIQTANSIYEIQVSDKGTARCRKEGEPWRKVQVEKGDMSFLDKLYIGPSFDVPGVVLTSMVKQIQHLVPSRRKFAEVRKPAYGLPGIGDMMAEIVGQVAGNKAIVVKEVK